MTQNNQMCTNSEYKNKHDKTYISMHIKSEQNLIREISIQSQPKYPNFANFH